MPTVCTFTINCPLLSQTVPLAHDCCQPCCLAYAGLSLSHPGWFMLCSSHHIEGVLQLRVLPLMS
jgi:hypothetical protein